MSDHTTTEFPDDFASNKEKNTPEYGRKVGKAMSDLWMGGNLSARRIWIDLMRSFSRGEQDTTPEKETIEGTRKDKESEIGVKTHKIDYTPLKILASFRDIVINPIDESLFKPGAEAIDITAINEKKEKFKQFEKDFFLQDVDQIIKEGVGVDMAPKDIPKDERALKIKKAEWKPDIEIAQEEAIENVMLREKFEALKDKVNEEFFDLGHAVGRLYTDRTEGIKMKYQDPYNWIYSPFETEDGRDIRCHGIADNDTIVQIEKMSGRKLTKEELKKLKDTSMATTSKTEESNAYMQDVDGDRMVEYIYFEFLTRKKRVFKKRDGKVVDRTNDDVEYNPKNPNKKIDIPYQVWYEGLYIPSADMILKWEEIPIQVESEINHPISNFKVYAPKIKRLSEKGYTRFDSMTERAIPIIKDIHRDWYKFQQLKMEVRPNTATINPQALENVFLSGIKVKGQDILDLFFGRGILLANEVNEDGDPVGKAITEQPSTASNSLLFFSNEMVKNYDRLRNLLGINEIRDGTTRPNSKVAVAVTKILLASSNNSTSHIVRGSFNLSLAFAEGISLRLYDVLTTPALKNRYLSIIGSRNVDLLDATKKIPMHKFGIYFDFRPDDEERLAFERSLLDSYEKKEINVAQYNRIRQVRNVKSAIKNLELIIEENQEKETALKTQIIKEQAEAQGQTQVVVENKKQQTALLGWKITKQEKLVDAEIGDKTMIKEALIEEEKAKSQHVRAMELKSLEVVSKDNLEDKKQKGKIDLVDRTSSNTSQITDQKQKKTGPIDFENKLSTIIDNNKLVIPDDDFGINENN